MVVGAIRGGEQREGVSNQTGLRGRREIPYGLLQRQIASKDAII